MVPNAFSVTATDGEARAGILRTAHGDVPTPVFMPVGTKATVKAVDPDELHRLGASIVLGNTYHLHFRPGAETIAGLGGLHAFMGWDGPILTDSGGFQVFSLRDTLLACDEDGVTFRSVYDGEAARFTPESVAAVQALLGSDIAMCLDVCPPADASDADARRAVELTTAWARRQIAAPRAPGQLLFGIAQGGVDPELRRRSVEEIVALGFDGHALGGLSVGESRDVMLETVAAAAPHLPADKPRYFMGIGDPLGILDAVERGIDMVDCVLPTRVGRTGSALTWEGRLNLKNARFTRDPGPLDEGLRLPRLHALLARLYPAPGHAAGDPRPAPAHAAQPALPAPPDRRGPRGDRGRGAGRLQATSRVPARLFSEPRAGGDAVSIVALAVLIALLVLFWFVWVVPQRRRQRRQVEDLMRLIELLEPGDEIITAGGIHGTVRGVYGEELSVEIAPGVEVRLDRRAVAAVTTIDEAAGEPEDVAAGR